jgi:uncharacterized membrane protein YeaQ/YmgE (transglycosylase-associated protein family)
MIGMDLRSFLILLLISVAVSAVLHYGFKFYVRAGTGSFLSKAIIGWIGAWLGSPVFGHWPEGLSYGEVYYVPAILGSFALLVLVVDVVKSTCGASAEEEAPAKAQSAQF